MSREASVRGCINCFCMAIPTQGRPTSCSSSGLYRDKIRAVVDLEDDQFSLVDSTMDTVISGSELTMNLTNREVSYDRFQQFGDTIFYWKLPAEFLGNKVKRIDEITFLI